MFLLGGRGSKFVYSSGFGVSLSHRVVAVQLARSIVFREAVHHENWSWHGACPIHIELPCSSVKFVVHCQLMHTGIVDPSLDVSLFLSLDVNVVACDLTKLVLFGL